MLLIYTNNLVPQFTCLIKICFLHTTEEQLKEVFKMVQESKVLRDEMKMLKTELTEANRRVKEMQECKLLTF